MVFIYNGKNLSNFSTLKINQHFFFFYIIMQLFSVGLLTFMEELFSKNMEQVALF